jgi:ParB-like chromosome segregation protein Spo0J
VTNLTFPCLNVLLVPIDQVTANDYNPNKVAVKEMDLLINSIECDGVTQPTVVYFDVDSNKYIVIDGFHRYLVLRDHFKSEFIPVVVLDKSIESRMASTIRHNRARGKHQVDLIGSMVKELIEKGQSDKDIQDNLGMTSEELYRMKQHQGIAHIMKNDSYSNSWEVI